LICLGLTLRDKLMTFWKNKKADEITKSLFLNKVKNINYKKVCIYYCKLN